jgi:hypothetical protein
VFAKDLNFPTAVAVRSTGQGNGPNKGTTFEVYVLESGHGLPSKCNDETAWPGGVSSATNPFTPDILVFDQNGALLRGPLAKPSSGNASLLPHGPSIDIAFENDLQGGRLFATDSDQAIRTPGAQNNSSRIVTVDPDTGVVTPFITGLPTGDHPAEQITFKGNWIYWSQGSTTNSGVVGNDNGGGANQHDIPCQNITLSTNVFSSGGGVFTSGYSDHGVTNPRGVSAFTGPGICDGAILRARVNSNHPKSTIEPVSWGYRNPYGIRFAPENHALKGGLFVTDNVRTSAARAQPITHPIGYNSPSRMRTGARTTTGGRTGSDSSSPRRPCSTRSAAPVMTLRPPSWRHARSSGFS